MSILLTPDPIDAPAELAAFQAARFATDLETGAVVSFTGHVRADGGKVEALELEAYPGFTETAIREMAEAAAVRHGLQDWRIVHRVGRVVPGETVVFVVAASAHRRAAFEGADQMMDYLKSRAPFWKKSHDTDGARWIDPRPEDYQDAARWDAPGDAATQETNP